MGWWTAKLHLRGGIRLVSVLSLFKVLNVEFVFRMYSLFKGRQNNDLWSFGLCIWLVELKNRRICSKMLRDSKILRYWKDFVQGTAPRYCSSRCCIRGSTAISSDTIPTVKNWANGNFWVGLSPLNRLLKPIPILSHTIYFIQILYSNQLFFPRKSLFHNCLFHQHKP